MMKKYFLIVPLVAVTAIVLMGMIFRGYGRPSSLAPKDFIMWCKDPSTGFLLSKTVDGLEFTAQYKPANYVLAQRILTEGISPKEPDDKSAEYICFNFRVKGDETPLQHGSPSKEAYFQRLSYLTFDIERDFKLIEGNDTLYCATFQFVQNYSLAPYLDYVMTFKRLHPENEVKSDLRFIYDDKVFGVGKLQIVLKEKYLKNIPEIKL